MPGHPNYEMKNLPPVLHEGSVRLRVYRFVHAMLLDGDFY